MEKRTPHCKLSVIKALIQEGKVHMTASAVASAELMGFNRLGMIRVILDLTPADFYKSMTTHADHTVWQDVYRPKTTSGDVYLKLTVMDDLLIVSFKEL